jgi:hypothetical protein
MIPLQNDPPTAPTRGEKSKISHFAYARSEPGFGFCAKFAAEFRSRFSYWSTKMRFRRPGWGTTSGSPSGAVWSSCLGGPGPVRRSDAQRGMKSFSHAPQGIATFGNLPGPFLVQGLVWLDPWWPMPHTWCYFLRRSSPDPPPEAHAAAAQGREGVLAIVHGGVRRGLRECGGVGL